MEMKIYYIISRMIIIGFFIWLFILANTFASISFLPDSSQIANQKNDIAHLSVPTHRPAYLKTIAQSSERTLVILVHFPETDLNVFGKTTQDHWNSLFFGNKPSIRDYFSTNSYGKLNLIPAEENNTPQNNGVVGWYTLLNSLNWYKSTYSNKYEYYGQIAKDAIISSNDAVDYSLFDDNNDGYISSHELHIYVIAACYDESYNNPPEPRLRRAHYSLVYQDGTWNIPLELDDKTIGDEAYNGGISLSGEILVKYGNSSKVTTKVGMLAHEFGHDLGLPEHYIKPDHAYNWCVMGAGDVYVNDANYPNHICAAHKEQLGWVNPTIIQSDISRNISQIETSGECLKLWENGNPNDEYFLVENRNNQSTGNYDSSIPASGLLVWHIDKNRTTVDKNQGVALEQADNEDVNGVGNAGDPFVKGKEFLQSISFPNSRSNKGYITGIAITGISDADQVMNADIRITHVTQSLAISATKLKLNGTINESCMISASLVDEWSEPVHWEKSLVEFRITNGHECAEIVEKNAVNAIDGVATVQLQAKNSIGTVTIEASTNDLESQQITIEVIVTNIIYVSTNGSDEKGNGSESLPFASIQHAINTASSGDVVLVNPGTYYESIRYGKDITVASQFVRTKDENFVYNTIIDGTKFTNPQSVAYFNSGETREAKLIGFTIQNGAGAHISYPWHHAGGISIHGASPTISHCNIVNNKSTYEGGGIFCRYGSPLFEHCLFAQNNAPGGGALTLIHNIPELVNCTIVDNFASNHTGGVYCYATRPIIKNCIIWGNQAPNNPNFEDSHGAVTTISYSDVEGGFKGSGNINKDPQFCDNIEYALNSGSPCANVRPGNFNMGARGIGCGQVNVSSNIEASQSFVLKTNYPNPFNQSTIVDFYLPEQSAVKLIIYDILGRNIRNLLNEKQEVGWHSVQWNGKDKNDCAVPSGIYLYMLHTEKFKMTKKMTLLR